MLRFMLRFHQKLATERDPPAVFQKIRIREIRIRKMRRIPYTDSDTKNFDQRIPAFKIFIF